MGVTPAGVGIRDCQVAEEGFARRHRILGQARRSIRCAREMNAVPAQFRRLVGAVLEQRLDPVAWTGADLGAGTRPLKPSNKAGAVGEKLADGGTCGQPQQRFALSRRGGDGVGGGMKFPAIHDLGIPGSNLSAAASCGPKRRNEAPDQATCQAGGAWRRLVAWIS